MEPLDENTLNELAKTNPDLVQQYRAKMAAPNAGVQQAQDMQSYGDIANVAGGIMNQFGNANRPKDVILHNRMDQLGSAPKINATPQRDYDDKLIEEATSRGLSRAKENQANAQNNFNAEMKLHHEQRSQNKESAAAAKDQAANDPNSPQSQQSRAYLKQLVPNAASMEGFEGMSASQIEKMAPGLLDKYKIDEQAKSRVEEGRQRTADRNAMMAGRREDKAADRVYKEEQVKVANTEKKKTALNEVEDRRTNITQNLDILDKMIDEDGTYEAFGSHNQDMDRLVDQIATDMAKLSDPSSVARPSEVEQVKKNLVSSGFSNANGTARDVIKNFRSEVERRAANAYTIRGIESPSASPAPKTGKPDWAK